MLADKSDIAERIRRARVGRGLSQVELAAMIGVTQGTISRAESAVGDIRLATLLEVTRALDLDVIVIDRSKRAMVTRLVDEARPGPTAIYTGLGEEPYVDDDEPIRDERRRPRLTRVDRPRGTPDDIP